MTSPAPSPASLDVAPAGRPLSLRAGPLSLVYEDGGLRYLKLGGREVIRRIYAAVRDHNWGTVPARLRVTQLEVRPDSFELTYEADAHQDDIDFAWRSTITGKPDGSIRVDFDGHARSTFLRNRIGFCILHPPKECRETEVELHHADGQSVAAHFPQYIAPTNPFKELTGMTHVIAPGLRCRLEFTGDLFETEDQRNWVDASYKTFCTPLRLSRPVRIEAGARIQQQVTLSLEGNFPEAANANGRATTVTSITMANRPATPLIAVGLAHANHDQPLKPEEIARLRALHPGHLRVELHPAVPGHLDRLRRAAQEATDLQAPLEVALSLSVSPESDLAHVAEALRGTPVRVVRWLVFDAKEHSATSARLVDLARTHLSAVDPAAKFGSGSDYWFTQLNAARPPAAGLDFVCFSVNPQVHAFDDASLVETLETHDDIIDSARQFTGATPLVVSPVTFKMRNNPAASGPDRLTPPGELPASVDPRQLSLFGAAWTLGSVKRFAEAAVAGLTYFETTGWKGVMETVAGSPLPKWFPSTPGAVFPLYHVLADINEFAGGKILPSDSSDPLRVESLILEQDGRRRALLANLTRDLHAVTLPASLAGAKSGTLRRLNASTLAHAGTDPAGFRQHSLAPLTTTDADFHLQLAPHEVVCLDVALPASA